MGGKAHGLLNAGPHAPFGHESEDLVEQLGGRWGLFVGEKRGSDGDGDGAGLAFDMGVGDAGCRSGFVGGAGGMEGEERADGCGSRRGEVFSSYARRKPRSWKARVSDPQPLLTEGTFYLKKVVDRPSFMSYYL
jgi:hypothetical protein